ncbi:efflux RND transporter periplasmic adaptor subunit, partial [Alienimonas chondri]|uniref:efflux RND transporter periplasmic adaptor subunit n=1 Tax=Alienimonas chondri TaxID=2681879 RepID=UPI001489A41B
MSASPPGTLPVRRREDLVIREHWFRGVRHWVVKDPLARTYAHLRDEEFAVLSRLDGTATADGLRAAFARLFPGRELTPPVLAGFLAELRAGGLVTTPPGRTAVAPKAKWWKRVARWPASLLAIRFRGVDPTALLIPLERLVRPLFSWPALAAAAALVASAAGLFVLNADAVFAALPDVGAFLSASNLIWLLATLGAMKILHELGHGLTCTHFGGECRELGVMILVLAPCLYCDVSDAWLLADRRKRIAVVAAGVAVEVVLASAALWLWWLAEPGLFRTLCLNVAVVGSVSTVLFNGNPLLRYDGYFVLADLLEIPNLAETSKATWRDAIGRWFRGQRGPGRFARHVDAFPTPPASPSPPGGAPAAPALSEEGEEPARRRWLLGYGAAAAVYRVFLTIAIAWLLFTILTPLGLRPLAEVMAVAAAIGLVGTPLFAVMRGGLDLAAGWRGAKEGELAPARPPIRPSRVTAAALALAGLVGVVGFLPLPETVEAPAALRPAGAVRVFAVTGGTIVSAVPPGTRVAAGDPVVELNDLELDRQLAELRGRLAVIRVRRDLLIARRFEDPTASAGLAGLDRQAESLAAQLERREEDRARLTLRAPVAGTVVAPPRTPASPPSNDPGTALSAWTGTPLDDANRGAFLEPGTLAALIAPADPADAAQAFAADDPFSPANPFAGSGFESIERKGNHGEIVADPVPAEARLVVPEAAVQRVRVGQTVRLRFAQRPGAVLTGEVTEVSAEALRTVPRELA